MDVQSKDSRSHSGEAVYNLTWNPRPWMLGRFLVLGLGLTCISTLLSAMAYKTLPVGFPGVGALYYASIFYAVTTIWFGGWGLVASFLGALIGTALPELRFPTALVYSFADVLEPLLPFLFLRHVGPRLGLDPLGRNIILSPRNTALFLLFGAVLPPLVSGLWASATLVIAGELRQQDFLVATFAWWVGAAMLLGLAVPLLCRYVTPYLERYGLPCRGIWS